MKNQQSFTVMLNTLSEIHNEPIGKTLSKSQYISLMKVRSNIRILTIESALKALKNQIEALRAQNLSADELLKKIPDAENCIETILNTARASKPAKPQDQTKTQWKRGDYDRQQPAVDSTVTTE